MTRYGGSRIFIGAIQVVGWPLGWLAASLSLFGGMLNHGFWCQADGSHPKIDDAGMDETAGLDGVVGIRAPVLRLA